MRGKTRTPPTPRIEHDKALLRVMTNVMKDDTELFKQFMDNEGFKRWMTDRVFELACEQASSLLEQTASVGSGLLSSLNSRGRNRLAHYRKRP